MSAASRDGTVDVHRDRLDVGVLVNHTPSCRPLRPAHVHGASNSVGASALAWPLVKDRSATARPAFSAARRPL